MTTKLPKPDYGNLLEYFPFDEFRGDQKTILEQMRDWLLDPTVDVIICQAATGIGKSALALALAKAAKSAYIATANKALQDQYVRDFDKLLVNLKGRSNYQCTRFSAPPGRLPYTCADSPCRESKDSRSACARESACQYHSQRVKASKADVTSFNFASALPFLNYLSEMFPPRNLLVCDEAHSVWQWLTGFVGIDLSAKALRELDIMENVPNYVETDMYVGLIDRVQKAVAFQLDLDTDGDPQAGKRVEQLETLKNKLDLFDVVTNNKKDMNNFVVDKKYDPKNPHQIHTVSFKPVDVSNLLHDYFFRHAEKAVLLSAVILDFDTYVKVMGIDPNRVKVMTLDSPFPVENRPIYTYEAVGKLSKKNLSVYMPDLCYKVVKLMNIYREVKGIIHGVSWDLCRRVYEGVTDEARGRLLLAAQPSEQKALLKEHEESEDPTVLLSPSMSEGVDLKDDLSRLQIILKVPYPYLGDPVVQQRMELYDNYYAMLTAQALVQMYGRSIRSEEDWADTYVLDGNFVNFINFNGWLLPKSFHKALIRKDYS